MASLANNVNAAVVAVGRTLRTSSGSTVNVFICLLTIGSEQLFSFATFACPCLMSRPSQETSLETALLIYNENGDQKSSNFEGNFLSE